jgi:hypothetical protein
MRALKMLRQKFKIRRVFHLKNNYYNSMANIWKMEKLLLTTILKKNMYYN